MNYLPQTILVWKRKYLETLTGKSSARSISSPQLEVETVAHGNPQAESMSIYLDGDRTAPAYGPNRPRVRIAFTADGKTVTSICLLNDPEGRDFEWKRE